MNETRFSKIGANGKALAAEANEWAAVLDNATGLMWSVAEQQVENQQEAEAAAGKVSASGHTDWRLPTVEELFLLADRSRSEPAIDTKYFPDCKSDWYWTSSPYAPSPGDCAWNVLFDDGYTSGVSRDYNGFVRAVRAGQLSCRDR